MKRVAVYCRVSTDHEDQKNSIENQKTSHSYLFIGIEGIGKKMIAMEFAKAILCIDEKNKCCNKIFKTK